MQITAIILAGGKSTRMGTDKALLEIDGISLLEKSVALCKTVCSEIFISSNNPEHQKFGYPVIADEIENCGPIGGIYSCLKKSETDWNFVISVDAAFVEHEFIQSFISEAGDFDALVPIHAKGKEPLIALYHKNSLAEIEKAIKIGDYKMHHLLNALTSKYVNSQKWIEKYPEIFRNLNRPEDIYQKK